MTIRDRIFDKLEELNMTQKEFSLRTGIPQTTVSDWRKKKTNPTAEKIMVICKVLGVTPEWLLSGVETRGTRSNPMEWYAVDAGTEAGYIITWVSSECTLAVTGSIWVILSISSPKNSTLIR